MSYFYLYFFFINQLTVLSNELFVSSKPKTKPHKISKEIFLGDPTILIESNKYYLYGSSAGGIDSTANGFLVYESSNLKNWEPKGYALKKEDAYGESGFWAPQVFKKDGLFYMVYVANENIGLATSKSPLGPFKNKLKKKFSSEVKLIDPFIFNDSNKWYLYHTRRLNDGNEIYVVELSDNLNKFNEQTLTKCLSADELWEDNDGMNPRSVQGSSVVKYGGIYYLFYSANNFRSPNYAVGLAISSSPLGPWIKSKQNPLIDRESIGENGPGHGDVFLDLKDKTLKYVLHTHNSKNKLRPRKVGILKLSVDSSLKKLEAKVKSFRYLKKDPPPHQNINEG